VYFYTSCIQWQSFFVFFACVWAVVAFAVFGSSLSAPKSGFTKILVCFCFAACGTACQVLFLLSFFAFCFTTLVRARRALLRIRS
jgi:hypothetical protein